MRDREDVHRPAPAPAAPDAAPDLATLIEQQKQANELAALKRTAVTDRLAVLGVDTTGAPEGKVELGEKAGALAPWLATRIWQELAEVVSTKAAAAHQASVRGRVLVVTDHDLMSRDLVHHEVLTTLARFDKALESADQLLKDAARSGPHRQLAPVAATEDEPEVAAAGDEEDAAEAAGETSPAPTSPLSMSLDLLKLLRVDYTVAAAEVSVTSAQLADMVAGHLQAHGVDVIRDELALVSPNGVIHRIGEILEGAVVRRQELVALERRLAAGRAETKRLTDRLTELQTAWAERAADEKATKTSLDRIKAELTEVSGQIEDVGDTQAADELTVARATDLLTVVETGCASMLLPSADGKPSALRIAAVQEGIKRAPAGKNLAVTHVLYVECLGSRADVTTRHSLLGSSDRIHHVASSGVTWLLHSTVSGTLAGGGTEQQARQLVYSLSTGQTYAGLVGGIQVGELPGDPSLKMESVLRFCVVALALMIGLAAMLLGAGSILGITLKP